MGNNKSSLPGTLDFWIMNFYMNAEFPSCAFSLHFTVVLGTGHF